MLVVLAHAFFYFLDLAIGGVVLDVVGVGGLQAVAGVVLEVLEGHAELLHGVVATASCQVLQFELGLEQPLHGLQLTVELLVHVLGCVGGH